MEGASCSCGVAAAAVSVVAVLWRLKGASGAAYWTGALGIYGVSLYLTMPPGLWRTVLFVGSFVLVCAAGRRSELVPLGGRVVLVTGCDSGFGHELAKRLSDLGVTVFAGVLDVGGAGAQRLKERASENLKVLQLDVTDSSQIEAARRHIGAQVADSGLWGLVNNAGVLQLPADVELQPMAAYRRCLDVNFLGAVEMCQQFLPLLRRSRGRVVNISSTGGEVPIPLFGCYGASKGALSIYSQVMRIEMSAWGVKVATIQPTGFRTNIFGNRDDAARATDEILASISSEAREDYGEEYISSLAGGLSTMAQNALGDLSPVVDDMCHALLAVHPKPVYRPGSMGWLLPLLHRCCPTAAFDAFVKNLIKATCRPAGLVRS